jgi:hypothetical protein
MSMSKNKPEGGGAGCWLTAIITVFVAMILAIVALFLPPFNLYDTLLGEQYAALQAQGEALQSSDGDFTFALAADAQSDFSAALSVSALQDFEASNSAAGAWIPAAKNAVPYYLALQSNVYSIHSKGKNPLVQLSVIAPSNVASPDLLDLYGWYGDESSGEWRFIPSRYVNNRLETVVDTLPAHLAVFQAAPDAPHVMLSYGIDTSLNGDAALVSSVVSPAGLQAWMDGTVQGQLAAGSDSNGNYIWMPVIRNFADPRAIDSETVVAIISNPALRSKHISELSSLVNTNGFDGLVIDYRAIPTEQRENYSAFIRELNERLTGLGRSLAVVVPAAENIAGVWETGAYDWRALGAEVDYFQIQLGLNPLLYTIGDNQFVEALLRWAVGEVDRSKITLKLSALSVRDIAGVYTSIGYDEALAGLGNVIVEADNVSETGTIRPGSTLRAHLDGRQAIGGVNEDLNAPYLDYVDNAGNVTARIWVTTGNALRFRMDWTSRFALGGIAFDDLLAEGVADGVTRAIGEYLTQIPTQPTSATWQLRWRIVNTSGEVVQIETTNLDQDLEVLLQAPDGNYAINPSVVLIEEGIEQESVRTGAQVALFSPTATPTPPPTATPAPTATVTPTPAPIVATNAPAVTGGGGGGGGSTNPVAGGRIDLNGFEYGGHVTSAASPQAISAMQSAGMTWMKVQVRYSGDAGGAIAAVQQAHAAGFRILIGTVGSPQELAAGGSAYITNYANWLGAIAAGGADAIEVWNEPNLDREWPNGQLSGESYTAMLRAAYTAIKSANGSTIVISAAPAPTGAEAAYPGAVLNDDNFLRQMVAAGGLNYLDCVGAHYNEGIVGPLETSGDPRGGYYTRYLPTTVQVYRSIVGGKPICFTELGYLTPEGYPPLPDYFSWGSGTTVAQQSAWLAQAAAFLSQQSDVRLMIVWNIDFTAYAGDPQGGYAIIRPGGSCPACSALSGAR